MNRIGLAVAVLLGIASAAPAWAGRDVLREQSRQSVSAAGLSLVRVENSRGDVTLEAGSAGEIQVTALKVVHSGSRPESERMARELQVEARKEAGQYVIRVRYPSRQSIRIGFWDLFRDFQIPSAEIKIAVQVPAGMPVAVRTASGDIRTAGLPGTQTLDTASGDIEVDEARGDVRISTASGDVTAGDITRARVRTVSGDVEIEGVRGPLDVHTTSGDLTIHGAADSLVLGTVTGDVRVTRAPRGLRLSTTSGEVVARDVAGRVEIGASSGDVEVGLSAPFAGADVTTSSGDISVWLGRGVGGELELRTSNGTLDLNVPIEVATMTRRVVTGRVRQGNTPIVLRSASGDIHITTGEKGS